MPPPKKARQPADHAAKAEAKGDDITIDYGGVVYVIERAVVNDANLVDMIADMMDNPVLLPRVVRTMLGPEQWARFKTAASDKDGRLPLERLGELFQALDDAAGKSVTSPSF